MNAINTPGMNDLTLRLEDLATRLLDAFPANDEMPPAVLVTSARAGEGKTTVALAMARVMAFVSGEPVLLVDANFHGPALANSFLLPPSLGFADVLRQPESPPEISTHALEEGLSLITAGSAPLPVLLTRAHAISGFRKRFTQAFRCVIFDGAESRLGGAALAKHVDGVLLTIDSGATRREVVNGTIADMRLPPGRLIGAVLNKRERYIPSYLYKGL